MRLYCCIIILDTIKYKINVRACAFISCSHLFLFLKQYSLEIVKPVVMVMDSALEQDAGMFNLMP